jgi:ABC-type Na+ transport system ATPase subunit NatA
VKDFVGPDAGRLGATIVLVALYGLATAAFTYMVSFAFTSHSTGQNVILLVNVFAMVLMIASFIMGQVETTCRADEGLKYIYRLLPGFSLGNGLLQLAFLDLLPILELTCDRNFGIVKPLAPPYNAFDMKAAGWNMVYLGASTLLYLATAIVIDLIKSNPRLLLWCQRDPRVPEEAFEPEEDVVAEEEKCAAEAAAITAAAGRAVGKRAGGGAGANASAVASAGGLTVEDGHGGRGGGAAAGEGGSVVLLDKLRKVYQDRKVAVKGLSFGIPRGEVFGFLGESRGVECGVFGFRESRRRRGFHSFACSLPPALLLSPLVSLRPLPAGLNGAGKSTTLNMLGGDVLPSSGTALLAGFDIVTQQQSCRSLLGYCPQIDPLLELLTAREHLDLFARIKGVPEGEVDATVREQLRRMDLVQYANKKAGSLSGGNKRKLCVAIALIGPGNVPPPILFLDEVRAAVAATKALRRRPGVWRSGASYC